MTIGLRLFISSAIFGIAIALSYWFTSHEIVGTLMLGIMAFGLSFVAGYMIVAEREADLIGDKKTASIADGAGELMGSFTIRSPVPFGIALAVSCVFLGVVVSPTIAILGLIVSLGCGALFILQSR
jgi:ABC-type uncharacterized transport system permease subunit